MIYILLAWFLPIVILLVLVYTIDEEITVGDFLQMMGIGLIPVLNWILVYIAICETVKKSDSIQKFLKKKLK